MKTVTIVVPSMKKSGTALQSTGIDYRYLIENELSEKYGGCYTVLASGAGKMGDGTVMREAIHRITCSIPENMKPIQVKRHIEKLARTMKMELAQDSVFVEYDGVPAWY